MRRGYREEVHVLRAPVVTDSYTGNETRDWAAARRRGPFPAAVQPASTDELTDRRQVTLTRWTVNMEPEDVLATDRVQWRGDDYDVDGEVGSWPGSPRNHLEFTITRAS